MVTGRRASLLWAALVYASLWAFPAVVCAGSGFEDKDLSLRLPTAFSRFATYADVAAVGGASAGSKWSSSINPASLAWQPIPTDLHLAFSPQYSDIRFREGMDLQVASEALSWNAGAAGTLQPGLAQVWSNHSTTRQGMDFDLRMDLAMLQWAKRFDDSSLGMSFSFTKSESEFHLGGADVSESHGEGYGWRFGVLHRFANHLLGGAVFDYAFSRDRTTVFDFMGLGIGNTRTEDTTHQFIFRPGLSYEYMPDSTIYADYQFATFLNDTGRLQINRFLLGVDHGITKGLFIRGGVALDTRGNLSWTAGLAIYPSDQFSIDMAYQDNMFPELSPEFGRSRTLTVSLCFSF